MVVVVAPNIADNRMVPVPGVECVMCGEASKHTWAMKQSKASDVVWLVKLLEGENVLKTKFKYGLYLQDREKPGQVNAILLTHTQQINTQ